MLLRPLHGLEVSDLVTAPVVVPRSHDWRRFHSSARVLTDAAALGVSTLVALVVGSPPPPVPFLATIAWYAGPCAVLLVCLAVVRSRDPRILGTGAEFTRVLRGVSWAVGLVAVTGWLVVPDRLRGGVLVVGVLGTTLILVSRFVWQRVLLRARRAGRCAERLLVVGSASSTARMVEDLERDRAGRVTVVDTFVIGRPAAPNGGDVVPDVLAAVHPHRVDTVLVAASDAICPDAMRRLGWALRDRRVDLAVAPPVGEVAPHRVQHRNIAGRPFLHLPTAEARSTEPLKRAVDIVGSTILLVVLAPVMLGVAAAVRVSSRGPVLYRQERIGRFGVPFQMLKFRSMRVGADAELEALIAADGPVVEPLFKVRDDPRVTRVGRVLRRYSLDELPQLLNVLGGSMSLVGPRPQRPAEVALYEEAAHRRLLTRPGMSGLWQVEGRSALPWREAIRLDLYYVDNRSVRGDLHILARTARAVAAPTEDEAH